MIRGVGLDIVTISRIQRLMDRYGDVFFAKVFTPEECEYCRRAGKRAQHYAVRFAAKEAALKALGVPPGVRWHDLEVSNTEEGVPEIRLRGRAAQAAEQRGVAHLLLSLSHEGDVAAAVVIADG